MPNVQIIIVSMTPKEPEQWEEDCRAAEQALTDAQKMPGGPERIAALKRAGQLRFDAYERKRAVQDTIDKASRRLRPDSN
jgi:hypothetical protein